MTWVNLKGKKYYMVELDSDRALLFTEYEIENAIKRIRNNYMEKYTKVFPPKQFDNFF